uniref:Wsv119-like protein n=1 Tax=Trachysalambria curvirostris nimavirus TaxID=2984282 RepID=A0A9C7EZ12_9VIRU|nr:MAG: wsv119-like protein [Trachysalambria curvirostris nimavirus]
MEEYRLFIEAVTVLIKDRLHNTLCSITAEDVEKELGLDNLSPDSLCALSQRLADETSLYSPKKTHDCPGRDEREIVRLLVDQGLVSFDWREEEGGDDDNGEETGGSVTQQTEEEEEEELEEAQEQKKWNVSSSSKDPQTFRYQSPSSLSFSFSPSKVASSSSICARSPSMSRDQQEGVGSGTASSEVNISPSNYRDAFVQYARKRQQDSSKILPVLDVDNYKGRPRTINNYSGSVLANSTDRDRRSIRKGRLSELFVTFDIDTIAAFKGFPELTVMPAVARYVIDGLGLVCSLESMPVKPCRRKDSSETWCQLITRYETYNVTDKILNFAHNSLLARKKGAIAPDIIKVYFSLDDTVDSTNPWGSCPLFHNGSNFRTPEFSRYYNEFTGVYVDSDTSENTCFVYSQKSPTIEIPSKLNIEAEIVMRGAITDADNLFVTHDADIGPGLIPRRLAIAMAFCHPKSRVRHMATYYFAIHLPKLKSNILKTQKCPSDNRIIVGKNATFVAPDKEEEGEEGKERNRELSSQNNSISRKLSVASYRCLACRGEDNMCIDRDRSHRFPAWHGGECSPTHLSHGRCSKSVEILYSSKRNTFTRKLASAVEPGIAAADFAVRNCERGAICHIFFCKGVQPVSTVFSPIAAQKKKLVLYGKLVDTVNGRCLKDMSADRLRVFYTLDDRRSNSIPATSSEALGAFKDIIVHECNEEQVELYIRKNLFSRSLPHAKKWWLSINDLTARFDKHVRELYTRIAELPDSDDRHLLTLSRLLINLYCECKKFEETKMQLLSGGARESAQDDDNQVGVGGEGKEAVDRYPRREHMDRVISTLIEHHSRDDAATSILMHKSMLLGSRTVISGARCVVTEEPAQTGWIFDIRQYVVTMAGSAIARVSDADLVKFTPVKGSVSITTAPNDRLPERAHQTWTDDEKSPHATGCCTTIPTKCDNWRDLDRSSPGTGHLVTKSSHEKYIPPHLRRQQKHHQYKPWTYNRRR